MRLFTILLLVLLTSSPLRVKLVYPLADHVNVLLWPFETSKVSAVNIVIVGFGTTVTFASFEVERFPIVANSV